MTKQIEPKQTEQAKQHDELNEAQLDAVSGGTKTVDRSSANLFKACATGKHFPTAKIT
jgi:type VI protein secretion system component Hcp